MPISVHMLGLRLPMDCRQRTKKGHPAQSTTGALSTSSIQVRACVDKPGRRCPSMAKTRTIKVKGNVHQNLRVKSRNSGLSSSSSEGISGSSAMPQIGQVPGPG